MEQHATPRRISLELEANRFWVGPDNATEVRLFWAPIILDWSGTDKRLPHEIGWDDVAVGDLIIAVRAEPPSKSAIMDVLEIWHVVESDGSGNGFAVFSTRLVEPGATGSRIYDSIARLAGLPPCATD